MRITIVFLGVAWAGLCAAQTDDTPPNEVIMTATEVQAALMKDMRGSDPPELVLPAQEHEPTANAASAVDLLPLPPGPVRAAAGAVSVAALLHKIPKEAEKAFGGGLKRSRDGQHEAAARELEKAIKIDPDFAEAHANLGVQYFILGRYAAAGVAMRRAVELNPALPMAISNLAALLLTVGDVRGAESYARRALALSSANMRAHYVLGVALLSTGSRVEALQHLEYAAREVGAAREALAQMQ
jgi:tetratricopeptide (TPR) repeat protein